HPTSIPSRRHPAFVPMMRVLFPLDGSEPAYRALETAMRTLPTPASVQATVLVVLQDFRGAPPDLLEMFKDDPHNELFATAECAEQVFREVRRRLGPVRIQWRTATGKPHREILAAAKDHDLLVMHATSHGGRKARGSHRL